MTAIGSLNEGQLTARQVHRMTADGQCSSPVGKCISVKLDAMLCDYQLILRL